MLRVLVAIALAAGCGPSWKPADTTTSGQHSLFSYAWVWQADSGERVVLSQFRGAELVIAAIYTSCQETCPRTLDKLRTIYDEYVRDHRHAEFVVITIDPDTDTPDRLRDFRKARHLPAAWHLLTADAQTTEQLADMMGIHVMVMEAHTVHDSKIMVFDGKGQSTAELDIM